MKFEVLPGLPAYGDPPIQFDDNRLGSEGLVVRFFKPDGQSWIGNFIGSYGLDEVFDHPNGKSVAVVARGDLYVVDIESQSVIGRVGSGFQTIFHCPEQYVVILGTYTDFIAIGMRSWESRRISWDGFKNLECDCKTLKGDSWNFADIWLPFVLDIETGRHTGGAVE